MKKLLHLLLLSPVFCCSQEIPKKSTRITIDSVEFTKTVNTMLDAGYKMDKIDQEFLTIQTEPCTIHFRNGNETSAKLIIYVRIKDGLATMTGDSYNMGIHFKPIYWRRDVPGWAFEEMDKVARLIGKNITYHQD